MMNSELEKQLAAAEATAKRSIEHKYLTNELVPVELLRASDVKLLAMADKLAAAEGLAELAGTYRDRAVAAEARCERLEADLGREKFHGSCAVEALRAAEARADAFMNLYVRCRDELFNASPGDEPGEYATIDDWDRYTKKFDKQTNDAIAAAREGAK